MPGPRTLTGEDLPAIMTLKNAAGWNQTEQDWLNVIRLSRGGCFGIECDGTVVATTTAVCYADRLAWIGMVLTHPDYRGRGFARQLMERALDWVEAKGTAWIKLDATDMGRPLYSRLGFQDECPIERWSRPPGPAPAPLDLPPADLRSIAALDAEAFGADRSALLQVLAPLGTAAIDDEAYTMGRPGSKATHFGPLVSRSEKAARELLTWYLAAHGAETIYWDLLNSNTRAAALAREFGFTPLRHLVRMARPGRGGVAAFPHDDQLVFAIGGFEYG